ncbi:MAG: hypothetical protein ACRD3M_01010 [Thermoanaerobaculia bacterium]
MSGLTLCAPAKPEYLIRVGDNPGHAYGLAQGTCTWTKPWQIAGLKNTQGVGTQIQEITGDTTKGRGTFVDTMENGDKAFYNFEFTLLAKGPQVMDHKWELLGGTGKLQGVKGKGTCTATPAGSDGSWSYDCRGEHTLPK